MYTQTEQQYEYQQSKHYIIFLYTLKLHTLLKMHFKYIKLYLFMISINLKPITILILKSTLFH